MFDFTAFLYLFFSHPMQPINASRINCLITVNKNIGFLKVFEFVYPAVEILLDYLTYVVCTS